MQKPLNLEDLTTLRPFGYCINDLYIVNQPPHSISNNFFKYVFTKCCINPYCPLPVSAAGSVCVCMYRTGGRGQRALSKPTRSNPSHGDGSH